MRKINLPEITVPRRTEKEIEVDGQRVIAVVVEPATAQQVLEGPLYDHKGQGLPVVELRKRWKIADKLEAVKNGAVYLEDDEWATLNPLVQNYNWTLAHRDIDKICLAVEQAVSVDVAEVEGNREQRRAAGQRGKSLDVAADEDIGAPVSPSQDGQKEPISA